MELDSDRVIRFVIEYFQKISTNYIVNIRETFFVWLYINLFKPTGLHTTRAHCSDTDLTFVFQDSDEAEEDEDMALQSGSEGTSSEPREDHTDTSSVEVSGSRPRRAATLRGGLSSGNPTGSQEGPEARRRSTRSLSAYSQNNKYQPPKGQDMQVPTVNTPMEGRPSSCLLRHVYRLV